MAFLRTILIIFIIYYVIRFFMRYMFPSLLVNYVDKKMKDFTSQQHQKEQQARKREGEVTIDYHPPKSDKNKPDKGGDYVDYVEVKD
jgi:hypothetical protein